MGHLQVQLNEFKEEYKNKWTTIVKFKTATEYLY
jgi:hypothetical protein